jgi:hypothetical protein
VIYYKKHTKNGGINMADKLKLNADYIDAKIATPLEPCKDMKDGYCSAEFSDGCILEDEEKYNQK